MTSRRNRKTNKYENAYILWLSKIWATIFFQLSARNDALQYEVWYAKAL